MVVAFFESIKYVGHLFPIAFLRVFLGYFYLSQALLSFQNRFLTQAYLAEQIRNYLPKTTAPEWYKVFLDSVVVPNWQVFAMCLLLAHAFVGVMYVLGYLVRPASLVAIFLSINMMWAVGPQQGELQSSLLIILHFTLGWLGAGRCLGIDYYFYRKRRGIWW